MIDLFPNSTFFYQLGIFLLVVLVLSKGLFKPVLALLEERKRRSTGTLQEAAALEAELEQKIARCEQVMQAARTRALTEREAIRQKASADAKQIVAAARLDSERELGALRDGLRSESAAAQSALDQMVGELSTHVVNKVLASILFIMIVFIGEMLLPSQGIASSTEHAEGGVPETLWFHVVNFIILVSGLVYVLKKPLRDFFAARSEGIAQMVNAAQIKRAEIEVRAREVNARLARLEDEAKSLQTSIVTGADAERRLLIEEAEKLAKKVRDDVLLMSDQELKKAKESLKAHALSLTFERAEAHLERNMNDAKLAGTFDRGRLGDLREGI